PGKVVRRPPQRSAPATSVMLSTPLVMSLAGRINPKKSLVSIRNSAASSFRLELPHQPTSQRHGATASALRSAAVPMPGPSSLQRTSGYPPMPPLSQTLWHLRSRYSHHRSHPSSLRSPITATTSRHPPSPSPTIARYRFAQQTAIVPL